MFRWGVISTAKIARDQMIPAIQASSNGNVTAIASRSQGRAHEVATHFGIPHAFDSYDALLNSDLIDGVYIPLPTSQHVEWTARAAEAGKHVLVEKPLALKAEEIPKLMEISSRTRRLISEAFVIKYHPQWRAVRSLIADGAIGRLRHIQGVFSYYNVNPSDMRNQARLGGGGLLDIGVYPVVTARLMTGKEPLRVQSTIERDLTFGTDIYVSARVDFGEFELSFYIATQLAARQQIVFHGDRGFIVVGSPFNAGLYDDHRIELHNQDHTEAKIFRFPGAAQYQIEAEAFADAAMGGGSAVFTLEESLLNQRVIDALFEAGDADGWRQVPSGPWRKVAPPSGKDHEAGRAGASTGWAS